MVIIQVKNILFMGGHTLGYWEGTLSTYQNVLDEAMELEGNI